MKTCRRGACRAASGVRRPPARLSGVPSTPMEPRDAQAPPTSGADQRPGAPASRTCAPGSEEDFILNVGRRIYFTAGSAALDSVAKATLDSQTAWLSKYPKWLVKLQGFADDPGGERQAGGAVAEARRRGDGLSGRQRRRARAACGPRATARIARCATARSKACKVQNRRVVTNLRTRATSLTTAVRL